MIQQQQKFSAKYIRSCVRKTAFKVNIIKAPKCAKCYLKTTQLKTPQFKVLLSHCTTVRSGKKAAQMCAHDLLANVNQEKFEQQCVVADEMLHLHCIPIRAW